MQAFVSAQVYALRSASVGLGLAQDHWGFAWQPRNGSGLSASDFASQTSAILDRLGVAIRDSGQVDPSDPGSGACGPPGQNVFCGGDLTGAVFNESLESATHVVGIRPLLRDASRRPSSPASRRQPISLGLLSSTGAPVATTTPMAVALTSGSPDGRFSLSPGGPWATTPHVTIPAGGSARRPSTTSTRAPRGRRSGDGHGATTATQIETVGPGPLRG